MTNKDWSKTADIDLFTRFDADEWKNSTMSLDSIAFILGALYPFLTNADLVYINTNFRTTEIRAMEREISNRSSKANRNATENELMLEKYRELNFRRVKFIHDYLFSRYFDPASGGGTTDELITDKINGTATGRTGGKAK